MSKSKKITLLAISLVIIISGGLTWYSQTKVSKNVAKTNKTTSTTTVTKPVFNKTLYSTDNPTSPWAVVNKSRPLVPLTYAPAALVSPNVAIRYPGGAASKVATITAKALEDLFAGAKLVGINLMLTSGYRSYSYQVSVYNSYVSSIGRVETDKVSARPGYSEHQTGLAVDIEPTSHVCELDACFANTTEGKWLISNAYKYGFIIRYPSDKTTITGYSFEPWHVRYVGIALATEMHNQAIETLEEFFNLPGGNTY